MGIFTAKRIDTGEVVKGNYWCHKIAGIDIHCIYVHEYCDWFPVDPKTLNYVNHVL